MAIYSSRIIKASALIADTRVLLTFWDADQSIAENLSAAQQNNIFAKASRKRVEDILVIFRQRYFADPELGRALATISRSSLPAQMLDRLLYVASARSDRLLYDIVTEFLLPVRESGFVDITTEDVHRQIAIWVGEGKTTSRWGEPVIRRVAQGVMATLRDFGVLQGKVRKRIAIPSVPVEAFAFLAFLFSRTEKSGERLRNHPDWRLLFLDESGVERLFIEAHQRRLLSYQAAGRVVRIEFPATSLEEYAHALAP